MCLNQHILSKYERITSRYSCCSRLEQDAYESRPKLRIITAVGIMDAKSSLQKVSQSRRASLVLLS